MFGRPPKYALVSLLVALVCLAGCAGNGNPSPTMPSGTMPIRAGTRTSTGAMSRSVNWKEFGFIHSGGHFNPDERILSPRNVHRLHKRWSYLTGCVGSICGVDASPAVANGVVYIGSYDGNVYALNAVTGAKLWSHHTRSLVASSPVVANGVVLRRLRRPQRVRVRPVMPRGLTGADNSTNHCCRGCRRASIHYRPLLTCS